MHTKRMHETRRTTHQRRAHETQRQAQAVAERQQMLANVHAILR